MFGSEIVEVAVGMVFTYLLMSLRSRTRRTARRISSEACANF
jgi:hypothetical protein